MSQSHTVESPPIPFYFPINNGLPINAELIVQGSTYRGHAKSFSINYLGSGDDIALHVNPRFGENLIIHEDIVLNSRRYGGWQTEERHKNRLRMNEGFRIRIVNHSSHFTIDVDDKVYHFTQRIPSNNIRAVEISGDITVSRVHFINFYDHINPYGSAPPQPSYAPPPPQIGGGVSYYDKPAPFGQGAYAPPPPQYAPGFVQSGSYAPSVNAPPPAHGCSNCADRYIIGGCPVCGRR